MIKIIVGEQLSGYGPCRDASVASSKIFRPLEQLIEDAKMQGFELAGMDIADVNGEFVRQYTGPVILLIRQEDLAKAIITKSDSPRGASYSLYRYNSEG